MDMRPLVVLERAFISYIASAMLGYIIVSAMGRFAASRKRAPLSSVGSPTARIKKEEQETGEPSIETSSIEPQDNQEV